MLRDLRPADEISEGSAADSAAHPRDEPRCRGEESHSATDLLFS